MKKARCVYGLITTAAITLGALGLNGCGQRGGPMQRPPPEVAFVTLQPEKITIATELAGRSAAYLLAEVRPQVGGIIQKRLFEEGSDVQAGALLYQIDPALYEANHAGARAALARAEANLTAVRLRMERYKELVAINAVSRQNYDDACAALKQAEAEIEVARAAAETARINLAYTRVTAPISGRIGKSAVTIGALVTAHQPLALAAIQQLDPIYVDVLQSTADVLRMQRRMAEGHLKSDETGQKKVTLIMDDGGVYAHEGALQFRDITVDPASGSVILRIVFPNPDKALMPGMFVRVVVNEGVNENAILAPQQAVTRDARGNAYALIVDAGDKVAQRKITVDRALGDRWLVSDGLAAGDRVIVEGMQKIRPGMPVKPAPFEAPGKDKVLGSAERSGAQAE